ncbi:hypothetical protein BDV38DRAFT_221002 [Aspergillus pseudotamarii]|uniref:Uncharacterized protein n=1 Tax=Aspergillus pseudotamarii TaxID=132259 RepID=A0A5N6T4C8_ASPPS|nr:uncharacterized protein BDV38DRAFT_221002 [Aspergillus pseudotamarii]KAE8141119.1 hypothetical protein BDV38DRAFT_221002 [Aspergillus pseudotamarii]
MLNGVTPLPAYFAPGVILRNSTTSPARTDSLFGINYIHLQCISLKGIHGSNSRV